MKIVAIGKRNKKIYQAISSSFSEVPVKGFALVHYFIIVVVGMKILVVLFKQNG